MRANGGKAPRRLRRRSPRRGPRRVVFGFDLVADQLRWVRVRRRPVAGRSGARWTVTDFGIRSLAVDPGSDPRRREELLSAVVAEIVDPARDSRASFYLSIYGPGFSFRRLTLPRIRGKREQQRAVLWEARKQLPFPLEDAYWTSEPVPGEAQANQVEVAFAAVLRTSLDRIVATFERAGVPLDGVCLGGVGFSEILPTRHREPGYSVGLLEITPARSYLTLYGPEGVELYREFSAAGLSIADLDTGGAAAEAAEEGEATDLLGFAGPIADEVLASLQFYETQFSGRKLTHLFLAGIIEGELGVGARLQEALPGRVVPISPPPLRHSGENEAEFTAFFPFFAKATGVAIAEDRRAYLLPEAVVAAARRRRHYRYAAEAAALVTLATAGSQAWLFAEAPPAELLLADTRRQITQLENSPGFGGAEGLAREVHARQAFVDQFARRPPVLPWLLRELSNITPPEVVLDRVALEPAVADSVSGLAGLGEFRRLEVHGTASGSFVETDLIMGDFIRRLESSPFFGPVKVIQRNEARADHRKSIHFGLEVSLR